jgi:hypothetical protein
MLKRISILFGGTTFLTLAATLVGCPAPPPPATPVPASEPTTTPVTPTATPTATATATPTAAPTAEVDPLEARPGKTCSADADCVKGESCRFFPGCDVPGTCGPPRACTRDLVPFCGCDGTNFRGSSSCPVKPFRHKGGC